MYRIYEGDGARRLTRRALMTGGLAVLAGSMVAGRADLFEDRIGLAAGSTDAFGHTRRLSIELTDEAIVAPEQILPGRYRVTVANMRETGTDVDLIRLPDRLDPE